MERRIVGVGGTVRGMEENTMAILDHSGFSNSNTSHHLNDDRFAFLEAVRTAFLFPDNGSAPTRKMFEAVFHILVDADSLDLTIGSYRLLVDMDERFPRVYLLKDEDSGSQLVIVEEAWQPFNFGSDSCNEKGETKHHSKRSFNSVGFHDLVQQIIEVTQEMNPEAVEATFLKSMLLLQYLIGVLESDFWPRNSTYREKWDWTLLRGSLLNMLLGSRKEVYKGLMKDCLSIMSCLSRCSTISEDASHLENSSPDNINSAISFAFPEVTKSTCSVLRKLFRMVMELDLSRQMADLQGLTTRADGVRTPVVEIILDELTYDNGLLSSFLQDFDAKQKLKIVLQYLQKYIPKSSVQTRRSGGTMNSENLDGVLKCFSNSTCTRSIIKKISTETVQLLLAHAFQAYLALSYQQHVPEDLSATKEDAKSNSTDICMGIISAFDCLRLEDKNKEISCCAKEALFAAVTILSTKAQ